MIAAEAAEAGVTIEESEQDSFSRFVGAHIAEHRYLESVWCPALPQMAREFAGQRPLAQEENQPAAMTGL
ncbi:MAG: hypothetical protein OXE94_03855 [Aestuariivita sp.]|nr:hypothetical protein [Aestuariivita sp.]MCY4203834.1 hypothetical protein [Aestuariivita sp.]